MNRGPHCPDQAELQAFLEGKLPDEQWEKLAEHMDGCALCQERTLQWRQVPLARPSGDRRFSDEPECQQALDRAQGLLTSASAANSRPRPVDPMPVSIEGYEILHEIARGGMGIVFKARQKRLNRLVALKMIQAGRLATQEEKQRFLAEAQTAAILDHPHIVPIYEVGEDHGHAYFSMGLVEGENLLAAVASGPLPPRHAAHILEIVANAVAYAHDRGIIHRDLKPANILLAQRVDSSQHPVDSRPKPAQTDTSRTSSVSTDYCLLSTVYSPKITDFGLAKHLDNDSDLTSAGQLMGTPSYMSPEQAECKTAQIGPATDIYSLGATLYCLLTGRPPFQAATKSETIRQVIEREPAPPSSLNPAIDRDLETICLKCMQKQPERRYSSAGALAADLGRFSSGRPIHARPVGRAERFVRWVRRNPTVAALAATALLATLAGGAGVVWQWRNAVANEHIAQELAAAADKRTKAERWERYRSNLTEAGIAMQQQDTETARRAIAAAPEEYRGWEWRYFANQLDGPLEVWQVVAPGADSVPSFALHPSRWQVVVPRPDGSLVCCDPQTEAPPAPAHFVHPELGSVAFSPDGKLAATVADDWSIHLWDLATRQRLRILPGDSENARTLMFGRDDSCLLSAGPRDVRVWDTNTGKVLFAHPGSHALLLPDARGLIIGEYAGLTYFPDFRTPSTAISLKGHTALISALALSPDGTRLASAGSYPENKIRIWDLRDGKQSAVLTSHRNNIFQLRFSPDGRRLASASLDQSAILWNVDEGKLLHSLTGHAGAVFHVAFSPDGTRLVTSSEDETVRLWDANTGDVLAVLRGHRGRVERAEFSHDGARIVSSGADGALCLWDARGAEASIFRGHTNFIYDAAFSPDGKQIASCGWDGAVRLWEAATGRNLWRQQAQKSIVSSVAFDASGRRLVTQSFDGTRGGRVLTVWEAATGKSLRSISMPRPNTHESRVIFHPRRNQIVVGDADLTVRFFDPDSGAEIATLQGTGETKPNNWLIDLAFRPDGAQLAAGGAAGVICVWDLARQTEVARPTGHTHDVLRVVYSPDGRLLATASRDKSVRIWDTDTLECLATLPQASIPYGLAFSPNGDRLAIGCADKTIRLWSLAPFAEVATLRGHGDYVHALDFSPDGTRLVSGSGDFNLRIWDTLSRRERQAIDVR